MSGSGDHQRASTRAVVALILVGVLVVVATAIDVLLPVSSRDSDEIVGQRPVSAGTWYCPVTAGEGESAMLTLAAIGREPSTVVITRYRDGKPVDDQPTKIAAGEALEVPLPPPQGTTPLTVRWQGGPTVAHWRVDGSGDSAAAPCESAPSSTWHLTGFDTTLGARSTLYLFNPYGGDAVARLRFATPDGRVDLVIADNQLVKAGTSARINLVDFQPQQPHLGVTVEVLTGRVVVQGQVILGSGRGLLRGAPTGAAEWDFAQIRADPGPSWLSIQNPSDRQALVQVRVSDPKQEADVLDNETSVPAGGIVRVSLAGASTQPEFGVRVTSTDEVPIVVSAFWTLRTPGGSGLAASLGAPGPATEWALAGGGSAGRSGQVSIYNPGADDASVTVLSPQGRLPQWSGLIVKPNARVALDLATVGTGQPEIPVRVVSDRPVVSELRSQATAGAPRLWTSVGVSAIEWTGPPTRSVVRSDPSLKTVAVEPAPSAKP
ncbi:MAG: DUF5719 family protein [Egibacteraceae bacterium]